MCSSCDAPKSSSVAEPSQISEIARSRLRARTSSCTAGSCANRRRAGEVANITMVGRCGWDRRSEIRSSVTGAFGDTALVGRAGAAVGAPAPEPRIRRGVDAEAARDPDRAELLREPLDPASRQREVAVDPDVRARRHLLTVEQRVDDDEELLVLRAGRVGRARHPRRRTTASPRTRQRSGPRRDAGRGPAAGTRQRPLDRPSTRSRGSRRRNATAEGERATTGPRGCAAPYSRETHCDASRSASHARRTSASVVRRVADRESQHVATVQPGVGDEDLAARIDALEQRLVLLVRRFAAEADDREGPRRAELPAGLVANPALELLGEPDASRGWAPAGHRAVAAQHRPELERPKPRPSSGPYSLKLTTSSGVRRYSGTRLKASGSASGRRVQSAEQPCGAHHLCGLTTSESARSTPSKAQRSSGQIIATRRRPRRRGARRPRARRRRRSLPPDRRRSSTSYRR